MRHLLIGCGVGLFLSACGGAMPDPRTACSDAAIVAVDEACGALVEQTSGDAQEKVLEACKVLIRAQTAGCK